MNEIWICLLNQLLVEGFSNVILDTEDLSCQFKLENGRENKVDTSSVGYYLVH
jgi:hypothetical protein